MNVKTIIGSETEFGLVPRDGTPHADRRILYRLTDMLNMGIDPPKDIDELIRRINWWEEDFRKTKSDIDEVWDFLRRLGCTGDYLKNGSRFYVDCAHLEYSTPECSDPFELVAHERCGEEVAREAVRLMEAELGCKADLLKRNADYLGHSYACHENYLLSRRLFGSLVPSYRAEEQTKYRNAEQALWVLHLASRQIFTGSGSVDPSKPWPKALGLSQRQPFVRYFAALDTTSTRAIINTRDRPYADPIRFGRLHVICGDSNRADWSNVLKYGTSRLVLDMLEEYGEGGVENRLAAIHPIDAFLSVKCKDTIIKTLEGGIRAIDAQRSLYEMVCRFCEGRSGPKEDWIAKILSMWDLVLTLLERNDERLGSMLDFFIKKRMFEERIAACGKADTAMLQSLEYNYHVLGAGSLFEALCANGRVERVTTDEEVLKAHSKPPAGRAETRVRLLRELDNLYCISWHVIFCEKNGRSTMASMPDPASGDFVLEDYGAVRGEE